MDTIGETRKVTVALKHHAVEVDMVAGQTAKEEEHGAQKEMTKDDGGKKMMKITQLSLSPPKEKTNRLDSQGR